MNIVLTVSTANTKMKSEKRYIEISFEELEKYNEKENRIYNQELLEKYMKNFINIKKLLSDNNFDEVNKELLSIFQSIASELEQKFLNS
jgi:TRAP-type C4-dicarboxylate transport system substrate-binding protein